MTPHAHLKRGPMPKSSLSDALLCSLVYLHIDADHAELAKALGCGEAQFSGNLNRVRPILNSARREKWPDDEDRPIAEVGLLVGTTTVESFRPLGRFYEAKHYFDAHSWVYGRSSSPLPLLVLTLVTM